MSIQKVNASNGDGETEHRGIGLLSVDTQILYDHLLKLQGGQEATYAELSALIQSNIRGEAAGKLYSARRKLLHEHRINIGTVRSVGVRRLTDVETVISSTAAVSHIRRTARRAMRKLGSVANFAALSGEMRNKHNSQMSVLGVMDLMSRPKQIQRLENKVAEIQRRLPIAETLQLFEKKGG
ncbi:MAG: hypothetical protein AABY46_06620 [Nitrospirota bacterium]